MRPVLRHIISVASAQIAVLWSTASAQDLALDAFLAQVDQSNPTAVASKLRARALERRVDPSSTLDDPFFAAGPDEIPFGGGMGSVTRFQVSQSIPFPGKLGARGAAAEGRARSALADAETTKRQITVTATQTFFRAFFNQEAIALNDKLRKILDETAQSTKARYRTGDVGHHDWLLARVELSVLEVEKLRLEREKRTLHAFLNELRDESPEKYIGRVVLGRNGSGTSSAIEEPSPGDSPELKSLDAAIQSTEEERRLAKLSYLPDFVVQGMAMRPNSAMAEPANWGVMVGISLPLYFWRKQSESLAAANLDLEAAVSEKRSLENRLRTEIVDARQQLKTARDIVELYRKTVVPNTQLAVSNARSGYAARRLPLQQFLDVLKTQRTQELELLAAELDAQAAELRLKEVLSAPPILRLTPARPTLFGGAAMGASDTVRMGAGMSGSTRKQTRPSEPGASGMGGM